MIIALDGTAGSGKSTVSKLLAKKLGITHINTGAMYRALGFKAKQIGMSVPFDDLRIRQNIITSKVELKTSQDGTQNILLDGKDVTDKIFNPEIGKWASDISKNNLVRDFLVDLQREIGRKASCVMDGRDIGTNVFPDADFKFYLDADIHVRAKRVAYDHPDKDTEELVKMLDLRDAQDKGRSYAPLKQAADAVFIDTSNLTIEEVITKMMKTIKK